MKTIWKYRLHPGRTTHLIPKGAHVLTAQWQGGQELGDAMLWALVDSDADEEQRHFLVVGTGHDASEASELSYIATFQNMGLVWHVFETD